VADLLDRLTTALTGRYTIERELGAGGMAVTAYVGDCREARDGSIRGSAGLSVKSPILAVGFSAPIPAHSGTCGPDDRMAGHVRAEDNEAAAWLALHPVVRQVPRIVSEENLTAMITDDK
jgi:hypothetical protein